jgi:hypothetical protein
MSSTLRLGLAGLAIAVAASAAPIAFASSAAAAPTGSSDAQSTIGMLQAQGFHVLVSKVGDAPLNKCTVNAVRPGRKASQNLPIRTGVRTQPVAAPTVYVDLICKR